MPFAKLRYLNTDHAIIKNPNTKNVIGTLNWKLFLMIKASAITAKINPSNSHSLFLLNLKASMLLIANTKNIQKPIAPTSIKSVTISHLPSFCHSIISCRAGEIYGHFELAA